MKNLTWQNPEQLFVAQELINKVKSKCCGIKDIKLSSLQVLMYLGSTESIKLFLEHTDCLGIVSIRSITRELYSGQLRVVEIKDMPMLRDFSFAQPQGQESGLAQVFMQFAMHYNNKL